MFECWGDQWLNLKKTFGGHVKNHKLVFLAACIGIILISCSGPGKKGKDERPPFLPQTKYMSTMYDTKSFNVNADRFPQMYAGHNPELLYNNIRLRQEAVKRHPGETVEQYRTRIAEDINSPLMGSTDFDSTYAFRINPAGASYDAARRVLQLSMSLAPVIEKGRESDKKAFVVRYQPQLDNSYVITEKNGSRRVIEEKKFNEYAIMPADASGRPIESRGTIPARVSMPPEEAQKSEGDIMFLVIGKLVSPYASYEEVNRNPLPGASGVYLGRYHYLHIQIIDIWLYNVASGKIIQRGI